MTMLHVGMDLSRRRLDVCALDPAGEVVAVLDVPPDRAGLDRLAAQFRGRSVHAAIESMNGARFVHDRLEEVGWDVDIADAQKVKGLAPLACKTDRIDAKVLAELSRRELVPAIWLPDPTVRGARELARYRLHLIQHRTQFKNRVHATLVAFGHPCPVSDLFGVAGRDLLADLRLPEPWHSNVTAAIAQVDQLTAQIARYNDALTTSGESHPYVPLLMTAPGFGPILGFTAAAEIGDIARFASPNKLVGYTGLCPHVYQSGQSDRRGRLTGNGPRYLRWALVEAAVHASRHPAYADHYQRTRGRLGGQRGAKVARVDIARRLAGAVWHMLTKNAPFAPAGPTGCLATR